MLGWLLDPFSGGIMQRALVEVVLLVAVCGPLGVWVLLYRQSYAAESLSHGMLPGLVLAALVGAPLVIGAGGGVLVAAGGIALVARDRRHATRAFLELRAQGETLPRLVPLVARRVRDVLAIAARLDAGESPAQVKSSLKMSPWAADQRIKEARATDVDALQRTLEELAELELSSRGNTELAEDTAALRAIDAITVAA
jgi:hypothetical protein